MAEYKIYGGAHLYGRVDISGAKNGALPLLFATILVKGDCTFYNMPDIGDVRLGVRILTEMGAHAVWRDCHTVCINTASLSPESAPTVLTEQMRASAYLLGGCLGRFGKAPATQTGGCDFGDRPLDCHYDVFHAMGAVGENSLHTPSGLHGCEYVFTKVSVGATVNALLAASGIEQETYLLGCATEGHVVDLERFLCCIGVEITGIGTSCLKIRGKKNLRGTSYIVAPDDIEAGSYLCAAAACGGKVAVTAVTPHVLLPLTCALERAGCDVELKEQSVTVTRKGKLYGIMVETAPSPGFPTDLHPPLAATLCFANGVSCIRECVWKERFRYVGELRKMGADCLTEEDKLTIQGAQLHGAHVNATDLRGGAALVIAALAARGRSVIRETELLERGYEYLTHKLRRLGANIV